MKTHTHHVVRRASVASPCAIVLLMALCASPAIAQRATSATTTAESTYRREMNDSMQKMHHVMSPEMMTGNADIDFLRLMIPHHQGAVDMARLEIKYGKSSKVKAFAQTIIDAQENEIRQMQKWLAEMDSGTSATSVAADHSMNDGVMHHHSGDMNNPE